MPGDGQESNGGEAQVVTDVAAPVPAADERDQRLAAAEARADELLRKYAALVEEQKAFRARTERERQRVLEAERAQVAQAILESMDELERALDAFGGAAEPPQGPVAALVEGVRLALAALSKRVQDMGAERLSIVGTPFDPRYAEAIDLVPVDDSAQDQVVVSEVRAGYRIGDRILRPARVRVGKLARA